MSEHTFKVPGYYRLSDIISFYTSYSVGQASYLSPKQLNPIESADNELGSSAKEKCHIPVFKQQARRKMKCLELNPYFGNQE